MLHRRRRKPEARSPTRWRPHRTEWRGRVPVSNEEEPRRPVGSAEAPMLCGKDNVTDPCRWATHIELGVQADSRLAPWAKATRCIGQYIAPPGIRRPARCRGRRGIAARAAITARYLFVLRRLAARADRCSVDVEAGKGAPGSRSIRAYFARSPPSYLPPRGGFTRPIAIGLRRLTNTFAASSLPITATSSVHASSRLRSFTPCSMQTARA